MLTVLAPAKLNLTLEVLAQCSDGFNEVRSVIQTINLCDSLRFQLSPNIEFECDVPDWAPEESLVSRAAGLIKKATGYPEGARIEINKRIPLVSGLGGDSSDAATVLRGLNRLWGLDLSLPELLELAPQLGSDVAFFLYGGTALVEGRGEIVTPLPPLPHMWVVLVMPPVPRLPDKTKQLYDSLGPGHYTDGQITKRLVEELKAGREFEPAYLFNTFENVALTRFSELGIYREHLKGAADVHLAGSGPALFTLVKDKAQAEELYIRLKQQGLESYLTDTMATIEEM